MFVLLCVLLFGLHLYGQEDATDSAADRGFNIDKLGYKGRSSRFLFRTLGNDDRKSIIVLHRGEKDVNPDKMVTIFYPDEQGRYRKKQYQKIVFKEDVAAVTMGDFHSAPGPELVALKDRGLQLYQWKRDEFRPVGNERLGGGLFFQMQHTKKLLFWKHAQDINDSGRSDLILPVEDGYDIYFQTAYGELEKKAHLPFSFDHRAVAPDRASSNLFQYQTTLPNLVLTDMNGDDRNDIVCAYEKRVRYYLQDPKTGFSSLPTGVFPMKYLEETFKKNTLQYTAVQLHDLNQDGRPEVIVTRITGQLGVFDSLSTGIFIFYGRKGEPYPWTPDQIIRMPAVSVVPEINDMNGDGYPDVLVTALRTDAISAAWGAVKGGLSVNHYVYLFNPEADRLGSSGTAGKTDAPDFNRELSIDPDLLDKGFKHKPNLLIQGDFNADDRPDMLSIRGNGTLSVFLADTSKQNKLSFHSSAYFSEKVEPPHKIRLPDLNQDGRTDIVLRHGAWMKVFLSKEEQ